MRSINEQILDDMILRQIHLLRFSDYLTFKLTKIVRSNEEDIGRLIRDELRYVKHDPSTQAGWDKLLKLADRIQFMRRELWIRAEQDALAELDELVVAEEEALDKTYSSLLPVAFALSLPAALLLRNAARTRPIQGATLSQWFANMRANDGRKMREALVAGVVAGDTPERVAAKVVGTRSLQGADGATRDAQVALAVVTRSAVMHYADVARDLFYGANTDVLTDVEQFVAVLDGRTTMLCRGLDGQTFKRGKGPHPPLHLNCRSMRIGFLDWKKLGSRKLRGGFEAQWFKIFRTEFGASELSPEHLPPRLRERYARWTAKRLKTVVGGLPEAEVYQSWLLKQPARVQNDVLGKVRADLFRKGGLTLNKFVDYAGTRYSLADLARMHPSAFRRAGLDPRSF